MVAERFKKPIKTNYEKNFTSILRQASGILEKSPENFTNPPFFSGLTLNQTNQYEKKKYLLVYHPLVLLPSGLHDKCTTVLSALF